MIEPLERRLPIRNFRVVSDQNVLFCGFVQRTGTSGQKQKNGWDCSRGQPPFCFSHEVYLAREYITEVRMHR
jgi:hypothetical protein